MKILSTLPTNALRRLIIAAQTELSGRTAPAGRQWIKIVYGRSNGRPCNHPWIARVRSWPIDGNPVLEYGLYCGVDGRDGDFPGEVKIMGQPGDVLCSGRTDEHGYIETVLWFIVEADYNAQTISRSEARRIYLSAKE